MTTLAFLLSLVFAAFALLGTVSPDTMSKVARFFLSPGGLAIGAVLRIGFGLVLVFAAPAARWPLFVRVIGMISILGGLITPLLGVEDRHVRIINWWTAQGQGFKRVWAGAAVVLGVLLAYAVA